MDCRIRATGIGDTRNNTNLNDRLLNQHMNLKMLFRAVDSELNLGNALLYQTELGEN
jgi:hypothetical protein